MSGLRLLLVSDAVGGVWIYSLELARALRPLGVETVLALEERVARMRVELERVRERAAALEAEREGEAR